MNLVDEHNKKYEFFREITEEAMRVHRKFKPGLLESAYSAALRFLLKEKGHQVDKQVMIPMYWDNTVLDEYYRIDLLVDSNIILELKATKQVISEHRLQLMNYMRLTHKKYGMLINFGMDSLYSEWYELDTETNKIEKVTLM
ncbi:MAG: GxxExxY protein [Muribaculaceae bacterium]|nr:GxxExxY protein [Muribaculaceae bacterium]MBQ5408842.1 GxxExxY protein [Muribaculaceae bacterium]MDY6294002.1 GxxExxY protein [Bacteroidales bacterium]